MSFHTLPLQVKRARQGGSVRRARQGGQLGGTGRGVSWDPPSAEYMSSHTLPLQVKRDGQGGQLGGTGRGKGEGGHSAPRALDSVDLAYARGFDLSNQEKALSHILSAHCTI